MNKDQNAMTYIMIWLATAVVRLISNDPEQEDIEVMSSVASPPLANSTSSDAARRGGSQAVQWRCLRDYLIWWFHNRPPVFHAYAVVQNSGRMKSTSNLKTNFFASSLGAAALQIYHFLQILLLLNPPSNHNADQATRLRILRRNAEELEYHSREICAIALGAPSFVLHRQMTHPLQLAGSCFDSSADRKVILDLLKSAALQTYSPVEDVISSLLSQWQQSDSLQGI